MAVSIGRLGGTSYVSVQPQQYPLHNQAAVSSVYEASASQIQGFGVDAANPVQYPSAQLTENRIAQLQDAQKLEHAYHSMAAASVGYTASYDASLQAASYSMAGANVDLFG